MIEIEQGTGKYVTIAADEETALRWSGDIGFKMMQYNQIRGVLPISQQYIDERLHVYYEVNKCKRWNRCMQKPAYLWTRR